MLRVIMVNMAIITPNNDDDHDDGADSAQLLNTAHTPLRYQLRLALMPRIKAFPNSCWSILPTLSVCLLESLARPLHMDVSHGHVATVMLTQPEEKHA